MRSRDGDLVISNEVLFRDLDGESVLLHLESGKYFGLDEVGTLFWNRLVEGSSLTEIEEFILAEYEVGRDQLRQDLMHLVGELCEQGLLSRGEDSSAQASRADVGSGRAAREGAK